MGVFLSHSYSFLHCKFARHVLNIGDKAPPPRPNFFFGGGQSSLSPKSPPCMRFWQKRIRLVKPEQKFLWGGGRPPLNTPMGRRRAPLSKLFRHLLRRWPVGRAAGVGIVRLTNWSAAAISTEKGSRLDGERMLQTHRVWVHSGALMSAPSAESN